MPVALITINSITEILKKKNSMKKNIKQIIIGFSLFIFGSTQAQETNQFLSFNMGGGLHSMEYSLQNGKTKGQFGYAFNLSYSYFFNSHWGVQTGIGFQRNQSVATLHYQLNSTKIDTDGDSYEFRNKFNNWKEKQHVSFVDIPLVIQYQHSLGKKIGILASIGAKVSIPTKATYETTGGEMVTTAYYSQWNAELYDLPQHGLGSTTNKYKDDISVKSIYSAIAELGGFYQLSDKMDVFAGCYFHYGFTNLITSDTKLIYQPDGVYNGIFASDQISKVNILTVGLKVGIRLRINKNIGKNTHQTIAKHLNPPLTDKFVKEESNIETTDINIDEVQISSRKIEAPIKTVKTAVKEVRNSIIIDETSIEKIKQILGSMNLKFSFNSTKLVDDSDNDFKGLSDILKVNPEIHIQIIGHTCNIADYDINMVVGLERAKYVKSRLVELGVRSSQMEIESKGFQEPLFVNTRVENRSKNRRVELKIIPN